MQRLKKLVELGRSENSACSSISRAREGTAGYRFVFASVWFAIIFFDFIPECYLMLFI